MRNPGWLCLLAFLVPALGLAELNDLEAQAEESVVQDSEAAEETPTGAEESAAIEPEPAVAVAPLASDRWRGRIVAFGNYASNYFAMSGVNKYLDDWDEYLNYYGVRSSLGLAALPAFSGGLGYWIRDDIFAGVEGEVLSCETSAGSSQLGVDVRLRALELGVWAQVATHAAPHVFTAGLGCYAVSLIDAWEYLHLNGVGYNDAYRSFRGSGVGFKVMAGYQVELSPEFGLGVDLGYRLAKVENVTFSAAGYQDEAFMYRNERIAFDFGGFYARAGLRLYFQVRQP